MVSVHKILFPLAIKSNEEFDGNGNLIQSGGQSVSWWGAIIQLLLALSAGYLSWRCNADEQTIVRVIYAVLAGIFSMIYLLYYVIYHILMNKECGHAIGSAPIAPVVRSPPPPTQYVPPNASTVM